MTTPARRLIPHCLILRPRSQPSLSHPHYYSQHRFASSNPPPRNPNDPIPLEQPSTFRPPSHGSRRNARSTTNSSSVGAYNQAMTAREKESSRTKQYPRMFPNKGTRMHWFLTTRWVHIVISFSVLVLLGITSLIQTWSHTTPFAYLIPPRSLFLTNPLTYISEFLSVWRLHTEYTTQKTAEHRQQKILDAQKRRLYRRAHGMEDLEAEEISGPDVRGLVEWDDGLTKPQRERGGVYAPGMMGAVLQEMGVGRKEDESFGEMMDRTRGEQDTLREKREEGKRLQKEKEEREEQERLIRIGARPKEKEEKKRGGLYFGIWG